MKQTFALLICLPLAAAAAPIFPNSVASNDIDFITADDPSVLNCIQFIGKSRQEMPSKLRDGLFMEGVFVVEARYNDGTSVPLWLDPNIGDADTLLLYAEQVGHRIGQLPTLMRAPLRHIVINAGDAAASEEKDGGFFILYTDNIDTRLANHDLSETIFHEAAHVSLQDDWIITNDWDDAVNADSGFITDYAASDPGEDFAESALFAYTYLRHPERLPPAVKAAVENTILNRVNLFDNIIIQWAPHTDPVGPVQDCT